MYLPNSGNQPGRHRSYRADGSLTFGSIALILPEAVSRAFLSIQNIGTGVIWMEHGCARATATISGGSVTSFTILNQGFGFTRPPRIQLKGGGGQFLPALVASAWDGRGQIDQWPEPSGANMLSTPITYNRPAHAHAVVTNGHVSSIVIDDPGQGYINPPEVFIHNDPLDPFGCADPSFGGGTGVQLQPGGTYFLNGTFCHTDAIAFYAAGAASYYLEYAP